MESFFDVSDPNRYSDPEDYIHDFGVAVRPERSQWSEFLRFLNIGEILELEGEMGTWAKLFTSEFDLTWHCVGKMPICDCGKLPHYPIEDLCPLEAVERYPSAKTLALITPTFEHPCIYQALTTFNGPQLLYVGFDLGGEFSDPKFFLWLYYRYDLVSTLPLDKSFNGEKCYLYRRRSIPRKIQFRIRQLNEMFVNPQNPEDQRLVQIISQFELGRISFDDDDTVNLLFEAGFMNIF